MRMSDLPSCPRCGASTEKGFVVDRGTSSKDARAEYARGEPRGNLLVKVRVPGEDCYPMAVYRCVKCGHLEFYAPVSRQG